MYQHYIMSPIKTLIFKGVERNSRFMGIELENVAVWF